MLYLVQQVETINCLLPNGLEISSLVNKNRKGGFCMQHEGKCFWCMKQLPEPEEVVKGLKMRSDIEMMKVELEEVEFCSEECHMQFESVGAIYI